LERGEVVTAGASTYMGVLAELLLLVFRDTVKLVDNPCVDIAAGGTSAID
jgi:hypothetical protein